MIKNSLLILFALFAFTACATKKPILNKKVDDSKIANLKVNKKITDWDDISLILTFSGGGTRAASFSYGVLKELREQQLLDEIDVISSVSGGSFTAAYYGLYGEKIFDDFEKVFLKKPIQSRIIDTFTNPFNWFSLSFSNRSDYVAEYYEEEIFGKKTFADLRDDGPKIIINATDLSTGNPFAFSPENFHRLCSDWESYPIGRAVTASSAVPILFSPITLKNYEGCTPRFPKKEHQTAILKYNAKQSLEIAKYQDKQNIQYLHLVDGGIADNLGIRSLFDIIAYFDYDFLKVMDAFGIPNSKKVAIIIVNAADSLNPKMALSQEAPGMSDTMGATSTIQLRRYNTDTLDLISYYFKLWEEQVNSARCKENPKCKKLEFYLIELNFHQLPKEHSRKFSLTETTLELPVKKVDELINAGQEVLRTSEKFQELVNKVREKKLSQAKKLNAFN